MDPVIEYPPGRLSAAQDIGANQVVLGSIPKRLGASFVDFFLVSIIGGLATEFFFALFFGVDLDQSVNGLFILFEIFIYGSIMEAKTGQTIGKQMFHLKAIDARTGGPISTSQAFARQFFKILGVIWWALPSIIIAYCTKRKQRVGDLVAKTIVIDYREQIQPVTF